MFGSTLDNSDAKLEAYPLNGAIRYIFEADTLASEPTALMELSNEVLFISFHNLNHDIFSITVMKVDADALSDRSGKQVLQHTTPP